MTSRQGHSRSIRLPIRLRVRACGVAPSLLTLLLQRLAAPHENDHSQDPAEHRTYTACDDCVQDPLKPGIRIDEDPDDDSDTAEQHRSDHRVDGRSRYRMELGSHRLPPSNMIVPAARLLASTTLAKKPFRGQFLIDPNRP